MLFIDNYASTVNVPRDLSSGPFLTSCVCLLPFEEKRSNA
jgi:hypothetical protein